VIKGLGLYTLDENGVPVPTDDILEWGLWMESADRGVLYTEYSTESGETIRVSTVFLGIDHSFSFLNQNPTPLLFETMIFGELAGVLDQYQDRYSTIQEARRGHFAAVKALRALLGMGSLPELPNGIDEGN
jgi:hypothetical protein